MSNDEYTEAFDEGYTQACRDKSKHLLALHEQNAALARKVIGLQRLIHQLALIPAPDFYKPGDHGAGLVNEAWVAAREFDLT